MPNGLERITRLGSTSYKYALILIIQMKRRRILNRSRSLEASGVSTVTHQEEKLTRNNSKEIRAAPAGGEAGSTDTGLPHLRHLQPTDLYGLRSTCATCQ